MVAKRARGTCLALIALLLVSGEASAARFRFTDVTRSAGIEEGFVLSWGAVWADYNGHNGPDLFVNHHWQAPSLFRNLGEKFVRTRHDFYPYEFDRHGCAWGEANGDGRPDLYCTEGADFGRGRGKNQLLLQTKRGFANRAAAFGVQNPKGRGRTVNWIDFDLDGDLDLFVGNNRRRGHPNVMFENVRGGFEKARIGVGDELATISSSWADWDLDGDFDLLVNQRKHRPTVAYRNEAGRFVRIRVPGLTDRAWHAAAWADFDGDGLIDVHVVRSGRARILRNRGGAFERVHDVRLRRGRMSAWLDADNDGDLDLFVVEGATGFDPKSGTRNFPDFLLVQKDGEFTRVSGRGLRGPRRGNGDAVATADYDRDGRVDVLVTNGHNPSTWTGPSKLLRNRTASQNWAALLLRGSRKNPWGYGASISVQAGTSLIYWRHVTDGFNYRSQSDPSRVHLGLARARRASVRVAWPTGEIDCLRVRAGRTKAVHQGENPCPSG